MKKIASLFILLLLAACSPLGRPAESTDSPKDIVILTYTRSGGFAGVSENWTIYADGHMVSQKGEQKQADPDALKQLQEQLQKADFAALSRKTPAPGTCADCFNIELVWNNGNDTFRLSVVPESQDADPDAVRLVNLVQDMIQSAQ